MLVSILLLLLVVLTYALIKLNRNRYINRYIRLFIIIASVQWYYIPIIVTISGANLVLEFNDNILSDVYSLMIKELMFLIIIIYAFSVTENSKKIKFTSLKLIQNKNVKYEKVFFYVSAVFILVQSFYIFSYKSDYTDNNNINNQQGGIFQIISLFVNFFVSYFWILYIYSEKKSKSKNLVIISSISLFSLALILSGSRIYLLNFVFLGIFSFMKSKGFFVKVRKSSSLIVILLVSLLLLPIIAGTRVGQSEDLSIRQSFKLIPEQLNIKLNSFAYSDVLLKYDGPGYAGFNPYIGSFLKFVPRVFWNNKPTATSFNSEVSGIPARRIPVLQGNNNEAYNVGVSAFAVSYWQMGYFTVILSIFLNVLFLKYSSRLLNNDGLIIKSLGFSLIGFPQLIMIPTYGDNIVQVVELLFVFIAILLLFRILKLQKS